MIMYLHLVTKVRDGMGVVMLATAFLLQAGCSEPSAPVSDDLTTGASTGIRSASVSKDDELWLVAGKGRLLRISSSLQINEQSNFENEIQDLFFLNNKQGWVVDLKDRVSRTTDGGLSWAILSRFEGNTPNSKLPSSLVFADSETGWFVDAFNVWTTNDGAQSWSRLYPSGGATYHNLKAQPTLFFPVDLTTGWIGMTSGKVLLATDKGVIRTEIGNGNLDIDSLFSFNEKVCWAGTWNSGGLFYTTDGGKEWRQMLKDEDKSNLGISSIFFLSQDVGWLAGTRFDTNTRSQNKSPGVVMKTADGGKTWIRLEGEFNGEPLHYVKFLNNESGWLVGENSVFRTTDGGIKWQKVFQAN